LFTSGPYVPDVQPDGHLRVVVVGLEPSLSVAVATLLRRESAEVEEVRASASPFEILPAHVILAAGDIAARWLGAWPSSPARVVVFAETHDDGVVVQWLGDGADDVVSDAERPQELAARVRSVARRGGPKARVGSSAVDRRTADEPEVVVDADNHEVLVRGARVALPIRQFRLLALFVANPGRVLTRELLIQRVWESDDAHRRLNSLQVQVKRLRDAIEVDPSHPRLIKTVRGVGYRFDRP
jgi:two-component system response regulator RegX3